MLKVCLRCQLLFEIYDVSARGDQRYCTRRCATIARNLARKEQPPQCRPLGNRYSIDGDVATLHIERGESRADVLVSASDVGFLSSWTWRLRKRDRRVVGRTPGSKVTWPLARVLMGHPEGMFVDHINGDTLDNRRENLRVVTPQQNAQNHMNGYGSRTMPRGVHIARRGRNGKNVYFKVEHKLHGRNICAGYFKTAEEADAAAKRWRAEHMPFSAEGDGRVSVANA